MTTLFLSALVAPLAEPSMAISAVWYLYHLANLTPGPLLIPRENERLILKKAGLNLNNLDSHLKKQPIQDPLFLPESPIPRSKGVLWPLQPDLWSLKTPNNQNFNLFLTENARTLLAQGRPLKLKEERRKGT